jgi:hypothetical protein
MGENIPGGTKVALVSVASSSTQLSEYVISRLEAALVSGKKLVVVDRANLDKVREEQGFQLSGEVDDNSAKNIGKLLGAGAIVTGAFTNLGDVYSLTLKAINIETATVAVSYPADIAKSARIETMLASGGGAASGGTATASASGGQPGRTSAGATATPPTPAAPTRVTITYNVNGASGTAPPDQTVQSGESITIPDKGAMTYSRGTFEGWNTKSDGTGTPYAVGDTFVVNTNTQLFARWIEKVYNIGDTGPAGGIIFYDKGNNSGGWRYLEAAPASTEVKTFWASEEFPIDGILDVRAVGTGKSNTAFIMRQATSRGGGFDWAAESCDALSVNGYDDWFLPSQDELHMMYGNLARRGLGEFKGEWYWSSTPYNGFSYTAPFPRARAENFSDGEQPQGNDNNGRYARNDRNIKYCVRAIRQF